MLDAIANTAIEDAVLKEEVTKTGNPLAKLLPYFFAKEKDHRDSRDNAANYALLQSFRNRSAPRVFRVHPLPDFRSFDQSNAHDVILRCPCHILIPRSCLPRGAKSSGTMMCKRILRLKFACFSFSPSFLQLELKRSIRSQVESEKRRKIGSTPARISRGTTILPPGFRGNSSRKFTLSRTLWASALRR